MLFPSLWGWVQLRLDVRPEDWEVHLYYTKLGVRIFGKGEIRSMYRGGCYEKAKKIVKEVFFLWGVITLRNRK